MSTGDKVPFPSVIWDSGLECWAIIDPDFGDVVDMCTNHEDARASARNHYENLCTDALERHEAELDERAHYHHGRSA